MPPCKHLLPGLFIFALAGHTSLASGGESILTTGFEGGLTCTPAQPGTVAVNVRSVLVTPQFLLNGAPFSVSAAQSATFRLVPAEGEPVLLGVTFDPPDEGVRVVAGVYDVHYSWRSGDNVPRNIGARILQGVDLSTDRTLILDVPSIRIVGPLTMNGNPFPNVGVNAATMSLEGVYGLGTAALGSTDSDEYAIQLIPGAYRLRYRSNGVSPLIPRNSNALLGLYAIDSVASSLAFNVASTDAAFLFRIDGIDAPNLALENGEISLRTADGDRVELGQSRLQFVNRRLIPGIYDAHWHRLTGSAIAPANDDTRFAADRLIGPGMTILDVPTVVASGNFLVDGAPAPVSALEYGRVYLRDPDSGADVLLGETRASNYSVRVIPRVYDLRFEAVNGSAVMPANGSNVFELGRDVAAQPIANINVPSENLEFQLTLNGSSFPANALEHGFIHTRSTTDAEDILLADTQSLGAVGNSRRLIPGGYPAIYSRISGAALVPVNTRAQITGAYQAQEGSGETQVLDVRTAGYTFSFLDNGLLFSNTATRVASFEMRHREDVVSIGQTNNNLGQKIMVSNAEPLTDGRNATAYYSWQIGANNLIAQNMGTPVACYTLLPDPTASEP